MKYLKWGAVILVLVFLLALNFAPFFTGNNQVVAAQRSPGEPSQGEIYVGNVETPSPAPVTGGCCPLISGFGSPTTGVPSCH